MMKKLLFVFNPHSRTGQIKPRLLELIDTFVKAGHDVTAYPTQRQRDAYDKVVEVGQFYDAIVCSGGDGTLDETVSGMMTAGLYTPLGYIPAGSTNDFANSLQIPKNMIKAAQIAVSGEPFLCDVGQLNDETFVYVAAFGLFTNVSYQTSQGLKNILGHAAYILEGAKQITNVPSYHVVVEANGKRYEETLIYGMVSNSKSVGGMTNLTGKGVELDDGLFEVTLVRKPRNPIEWNATLACLAVQQADSDHVYSIKAEKVTFQFDEAIPWTVDGEYGGAYKNVTINNINQRVPIRVKMERKSIG